MKERLQELRLELQKGRQRWESLERERQEVRDTLLRIGGAIQVLEELMEKESASAEAPRELQSVA